MDMYYLTMILYIFLIYWFIVLVLDKKGILQRYNISTIGPILMIRTVKGQKLLELLATGERKESLWRLYANFGTILVLIAMVFMFSLILYGGYGTFMMQPEPTELNEPRNWLLIPGLNEFIPMCAWIGFVVALIVHEFSHAILSIVEKIKVKSMGLLLLLVPIGAFAEPDSEQLFGKKESGNKEHKLEQEPVEEAGVEKQEEPKKIATSRERTRILSAGVTSNFCVALIAFALFFGILFAIQPVSDTVLYVYGVADGSPAEKAGIVSETLITKLDGSKVIGIEGLNNALKGKHEISLTVLDKKGKKHEIAVKNASECEGVAIGTVENGTPAANAGLKGGMVITRLNNKSINSYVDFLAFMNHTVPGHEIEVQTGGETFTIVLKESPYYANRGYLGIGVANNPLGMMVVEFPLKGYLEHLRGLPASLIRFSHGGWLLLMVMPILPFSSGGFNSFNPLLSNLYEPVGAAALFGTGLFFIADMLFWIGWINFYVGLFNCLPAIPLDGGYVFREMLNSLLGKGIRDEKKREMISMVIIVIFAVVIFLSIVIMLVGPYAFELYAPG